MNQIQANNFLALLQASCGNGQPPLERPDWDLLVKWAKSQSLTALFYMGATRYEEFSLWEYQKQRSLQRETIAAVVTQANRTKTFLALYPKLLESNLQPLVLKGILVRQLYGRLADYRPSSDEDLYITPSQALHCRHVLEQNGWRVVIPADRALLADPQQELVLDREDHLLRLEVHPHFFEQSREDLRLCNRYFQDFQQRTQRIDVEGVPIQTLDETGHYLYLFLHLAKHFKSAGMGLRQVMDLMVFERVLGEHIHWSEISQAVEETRCGSLYGDVTALGQRMGFAPRVLFPSKQPDALLADSLEGGTFGHSDPARVYSAVLTGATLESDSGGEGLLRAVFPSYNYMVRNWPVLEKHPWLLPVSYLRRFYTFFVVRRDGTAALPAVQKGRERIALLRSYGILPEGRRRSP